MNPDKEKSKLQEVEQTLGKRDDRYFFRRRTQLAVKQTVHDDWHDAPPEEDMKIKKRHPFLYTFFIASALFFAGALVFAYYVMQGGRNVISDQNIDITLSGPLSIKGGEEMTLAIQIANNNESEIQLADLTVIYPPGTRIQQGAREDATRITKEVGTIASRGTYQDTIKATFFGAEKTTKDIIVQLDYRLPNSGTIYTKEAIYQVTLDAAPVTLKVDAPARATSGAEFTFDISAASNAATVIPDLLLKVTYPPGFVFVRAEPAPVGGTTNVWKLGDVAPGASRTIRVSGSLEGQVSDTKAFQISAGLGKENDEKSLSLIYNTLLAKIELQRPFLGLELSLNESSQEAFVAQAGQPLKAALSWINNTDTKLVDCVLTAEVKGSVNKRGVIVDSAAAYFSSSDTITWSPRTHALFKAIDPGLSGVQTFTVASLSGESLGVVRNPQIALAAAMKCTEVGDDASAFKTISAAIERIVKIHTNAQLSATALHFGGPFPQSGPYPPKADTDSTYTILWSITNTSNDLRDARVTATLPPHTTWLAKTGGDGTVTYNPATSEVIWNIGAVKAGVGYSSPVKQTAFQVSAKPSANQIGNYLTIIGPSTLTALDDFTKTERKSIKDALTSELFNDPGRPQSTDGKIE